MAQLVQLSAAIDRAKQALAKGGSHQKALAVQRLTQRRADLQATLPKLTLVKG